ncbi:MAG: deoxyribodipyrimidine photo-lyase [Gammaproteobacteria bacterium]|nr:deoxyribodipyrimidine photo-lyase [Gammaproteobacteria bacterium]
MATTIVWLRNDLRLTDNRALHAAVARGGPVVPVFVFAPEEEGGWAPGSAARYWLHQSLTGLGAALAARGSPLVLARGPSAPALAALATQTGADAVFWNRRYEPAAMARDGEIAPRLRAGGLHVDSFKSGLLVEPHEVATRAGTPFKVFTPFWRHCTRELEPPAPLPAPVELRAPARRPASLPLAAFGLEPRPDWADGIRRAWQFGEQGAIDRLAQFIDTALDDYADGRDRPDLEGGSRLSPYLHFGELSPATIWHRVRAAQAQRGRMSESRAAAAYLRQIWWREFAHHLLQHFPATTDAPLRPRFAGFPWIEDAGALARWQRGQTGYPIVDAGMRELWVTGWMHNRVRMIAASFLVKDLLLPWQAGARWFWDTLVDADLANNTLGWQWTAGCGADAAPYFRIFNPVSQGRRFDPNGTYVRRWLPALAHLPAAHVHAPWNAPANVLAAAGVRLGESYPAPMVEHAWARRRALAAYDRVKAMRG